MKYLLQEAAIHKRLIKTKQKTDLTKFQGAHRHKISLKNIAGQKHDPM